jgi:hypothetical protein
MIALNNKAKSTLKRFAKGFISGAITAMVAVPIVMPATWSGFGSIANSLGIAGVFGGGVGLLLAIQKWSNWKDDDYGTL